MLEKMNDNKSASTSTKKFQIEEFTLTKETSISGKIKNVGDKVKLTKDGAKSYLSKHRISQAEYDEKMRAFNKKSK